MERYYRGLAERHAYAGLKRASIEATRSGGNGPGGDFIDAVLAVREEIEDLRRQIWTEAAKLVHHNSPSKRGSRASISNRRLVDIVCLEDCALSDVLKAHGWSDYGETSQSTDKAAIVVNDFAKVATRAALPLVLAASLAVHRQVGLMTAFGKLAHKSRNYGIDGVALPFADCFGLAPVIQLVAQRPARLKSACCTAASPL